MAQLCNTGYGTQVMVQLRYTVHRLWYTGYGTEAMVHRLWHNFGTQAMAQLCNTGYGTKLASM